MADETTKIIKARLFTWFENVADPANPDSDVKVRTERIAHLGQEVDITDEASLARGEELDAFYSEEEAEAIRNGTFSGPTADAVYRMRAGVAPAQLEEEEGGNPSTTLDVKTATAEEIGQYIVDNNLGVNKTKDLVPADADVDLIEKFYDAENVATENEPRVGVTNYLDARLAAASQG